METNTCQLLIANYVYTGYENNATEQDLQVSIEVAQRTVADLQPVAAIETWLSATPANFIAATHYLNMFWQVTFNGNQHCTIPTGLPSFVVAFLQQVVRSF